MRIFNYFTERLKIDWVILEALNKLSSPITNIIAYILTEFGSGTIVFGIILFIYYIIDKKLAKKIAYIAGISFILNGVLKSCFKADRPFQFEKGKHLRKLDESLDGATGTSFPSGHSQNACTIYPLLALNTKKKWIKILCIIAAIIVPITRLYLGVHFPGDVVIGGLLGLIIAFVFNYLYDIFVNTKWYYIIGFGLLTISIPFLVINWNNLLVEDLFKCWGLFLGIILGFIIEEKYINFTNNASIKEYAVRLALALVSVLVIKSGLKMILPDHNIFHLIRYFLLVFTVIGIIPFFFKKEAKCNE